MEYKMNMLRKFSVFMFFVAMPWGLFSQYLLNEQDSNEATEFQSEMSTTHTEYFEKFFSLDWKEAGTHKLSKSNSILSLPEGYWLLTGDEAKKAQELNGNFNNEDLEALICDEKIQNFILFESITSGYVSLDDWKELDIKNLLNSIINSTEEDNKKRKERGLGKLRVIGWIQEPSLDKQTNTVYWAIEAEENGIKNNVNSVALRLGRYGYERIIWITDKQNYIPFGGHLDQMLCVYRFETGSRYQDFVAGDNVAEYGIAALVTTTAGGKILNMVGFFAFLKKIGGFLIAIALAAFYKFKGFFKGNRNRTNAGTRIANAEQLRKDWLSSLGVYFLGNLGMGFIIYFVLSYYGFAEAIQESSNSYMVNVIVLCIQAGVVFYFLYKRLDFKFIALFLFGSLIATCSGFIKTFIEASPFFDLTKIEIYLFLIEHVFRFSIYIYFWIYCRRLYGLNREIENRKMGNWFCRAHKEVSGKVIMT